MLSLNLSSLPRELKTPAKEILGNLGYSESADGIELIAEKSVDIFAVDFDGKTLTIKYTSPSMFFRGLLTFKKHGANKPFSVSRKAFSGELGVMLDCSRNAVRTVEHVKTLIRDLALLGYNTLMLYTEDTYAIDGEPYFGYLRGRYTKTEIEEVVDYAQSFGIETVPCIQTLAHLNQMFRWYSAYDGIKDIDDILLVDDDRTYELIDKMIATCRDCYKTDKIHIGMDEAHLVGRGVYHDKHGCVDRFELLSKHLNKVVDVCKKYDFKPMMWSDMFFRIAFDGQYYIYEDKHFPADVRAFVPDGIRLVYWDYYHKDKNFYDRMIGLHRELGSDVALAVGACRWHGFAPNNGFSLDNDKYALDSATEAKLDKITVTLWGDDGAECSDYAVLPNLVYVAERMLGGDGYADTFYALTGISVDDYLSVDLANVLREADNTEAEVHNRTRLYNDPFCGIFDKLVQDGENDIFAASAQKLKKVRNRAGRFGYIFETQRALCEVLSLKSELGKKTRALYRQSDKAGLSSLLKSDYIPLLKKLDNFYNAFSKQWHAENKPFGFEIQDYRIGGLIRRIKHCIKTLKSYIDGDCAAIPELDEDILDFAGGSVWHTFREMIGANKL